MKPIIALLPSNSLTQKIYQIRDEIIQKGYGIEDDRVNVLPHLSLSYLLEINDLNLTEKIKDDLIDRINDEDVYSLNIIKIRTWSNKLSLMFDNKPVRELLLKLENILNKYDISDSKNYLYQLNESEKALGEKTFNLFEEVAGDHMKIARNIKVEYLKQSMDLISKSLPKTLIFDKLVFMDYGCTEKDILWKVDLT